MEFLYNRIIFYYTIIFKLNINILIIIINYLKSQIFIDNGPNPFFPKC